MKSKQHRQLRDDVPKSFLIGHDSDDVEEMPSTLRAGLDFTFPTTITASSSNEDRLERNNNKRGGLRFVPKGLASLTTPSTTTMKEFISTTQSQELTSSELIELEKSLVDLAEPQLITILPSTPLNEFDSHFFTSTMSLTSTRTSLVTTEDFGNVSPPAPPPDIDLGPVSRAKIDASITETFTKLIELPKDLVPKRKEKKPSEPVQSKKPRKNRQKQQQKEKELDPVEFPISSRLESLRKDGITVEEPLALSDIPTEKESRSHDQFMRALDEQRRRIRSQTKTLLKQHSSNRRRAPVKQKISTTTISTITEENTTSEIHEFDSHPREFQNQHRRRKQNVLPRFPKRKFTTIAPFASTATFEEEARSPEEPIDGDLIPGVWYQVSNRNSIESRRAPVRKVESDRLYLHYDSKLARKRPIRVEGHLKEKLKDECQSDIDCGRRTQCCQKKWCDSSGFCSFARFCLPTCDRTKLIIPVGSNQDAIDILYD